VGAPVSSEASRRATGTPVGVGRHHFASVCASTTKTLIVLGVRTDDERPTVGDAIVLRLQPGRMDAVVSLPTAGRMIAACDAGLLVVDANDVLWSVQAHSDPVEVGSSIRAIANHGVVIDNNGGVWRYSCDGTAVSWGTIPGAHVLGHTTSTTAIVGTADGRVVEIEANGNQQELLSVGISISALSPSQPLVVGTGKRVIVVDAGGAQQTFSVPHEVSSVCSWRGRVFIGSTVGGLYHVDEGVVRALRPSLRAHQLLPLPDGLIAVSDLFVATTDALDDDFLSRDLSAFVRLASH
jgi:hypothetical protein